MAGRGVNLTTRLGISLTAIAWFLLLVLFLLGLAVVAALPLWMVGVVTAAGLITGGIAFLVRRLFKRFDADYRPGCTALAFLTAGVMGAVGLAGLPIYYMAYLVDAGPTNIPLATLSNGKRTVVFQGMMHVGSEGFYKGVVFDLEKALTDGYVLFYEGVQPAPGRPELEKWFDVTVLGNTTDLNAGYNQLAKSCSLTFQLPYFDQLVADAAINPKRHVTADVTYLDLKNEYDRLVREDAAFAAAMKPAGGASKAPPRDLLGSLLSNLGQATPAQKRIAGIACRGIISMSGGAKATPSPKDKLILDYRNKVLARLVTQSPASKIYITYGAAHFSGLVAELKALDPAWEVRSLSWSRSLTNPRDELPPPGNWPTVVRR